MAPITDQPSHDPTGQPSTQPSGQPSSELVPPQASYAVLAVLGLLWCGAAVGLLCSCWGWSHDRKVDDHKTAGDANTSGMMVRKVYPQRALNEVAAQPDANNVESGQCQALPHAKKQLLRAISAIFPAVITAPSVWMSWKKELLRYHMYLSLFNSTHRMSTVICVITDQMCMLLLLFLFYDFLDPSDDSACQRHHDADSCLSAKVARSFCRWTADGSCLHEPRFAQTAELHICVLVAVLFSVILEPLKWLTSFLTSSSPSGAAVFQAPASIVGGQAAEAARSAETRPAQPVSRVTSHLPREFIALHSSDQRHDHFPSAVSPSRTDNALLEEIALQRALFSGDKLHEFDEAWGVRNISAASMIKQEVREVAKASDDLIAELSTSSDAERGHAILLAFVIDQLGRGTPAARMFANKAAADVAKRTSVSLMVKLAVALLLIVLNGCMVFYIVRKVSDKSLAWQLEYLKAWMVQLALDALLLETVQCMWIHVIVPGMISKQALRVYHTTLQTIQSLGSTVSEDAAVRLNAPRYLFVAHLLASAFPNLMESKLVTSFVSYLPGNTGRLWQRKRRCRSTPFLSIAAAPLWIQSIIVRLITIVVVTVLAYGFIAVVNSLLVLVIMSVAVAAVVSAAAVCLCWKTRRHQEVMPAPSAFTVVQQPPYPLPEAPDLAIDVEAAWDGSSCPGPVSPLLSPDPSPKPSVHVPPVPQVSSEDSDAELDQLLDEIFSDLSGDDLEYSMDDSSLTSESDDVR